MEVGILNTFALIETETAPVSALFVIVRIPVYVPVTAVDVFRDSTIACFPPLATTLNVVVLGDRNEIPERLIVPVNNAPPLFVTYTVSALKFKVDPLLRINIDVGVTAIEGMLDVVSTVNLSILVAV